MITVDLGERSYKIAVGGGLWQELAAWLAEREFSPRCLLVSNPVVYPLYGERVRLDLAEAGFLVRAVAIPDGEGAKDLDTARALYDAAVEHEMDRRSPILALGGGVVGDTAGFVAATYMRGVPLVHLPTTLLAQVDSSIGGKVAVNHPQGKNLIGCFYQPALVLADVDSLKTLPSKELQAGLAEVIKYGVIVDESLLTFLEENLPGALAFDTAVLTELVQRSAAIKARVVEQDEREGGLRAILNFGHTVGHALETVAQYAGYLHGEAVAVGMVAASRLAVRRGFLGETGSRRIERLVEAVGLPVRLPGDVDIRRLLAAMVHDKKAVSGALTFILPEKVGTVRIEPGVSGDEVAAVLRDLQAKC